MLVIIATVLLCCVTAANADFCAVNLVPNLNGAWVCDTDWMIYSDNSGQAATIRKFVFQLPQFYAVSSIKLRNSNDLVEVKIQYWNDTTDDVFLPSSRESNWLDIETYPVTQDVAEFSGFSRLAPYWRLELTSRGGRYPKPRDFAFFARAGVAANNHRLQLEIQNDQYTPEKRVFQSAPSGNTCSRVVSPVPTAVVRKYKLDQRFYRKYTSAYGIPVMGDSVLDSRALQRACYVVKFMLADRED
uniref:Uncharacterized protein n=1 Tax=Ciona savignyi TaxID=51511 RepID=H2Y9K0_CIOSA